MHHHRLRPLECLFNSLFRPTLKQHKNSSVCFRLTSKQHQMSALLSLWETNQPVMILFKLSTKNTSVHITDHIWRGIHQCFSSQIASIVENVSMSRCHHDILYVGSIQLSIYRGISLSMIVVVIYEWSSFGLCWVSLPRPSRRLTYRWPLQENILP